MLICSQAVLPVYFTTYFRQVILGPVINFPMPPLPPLQPLPQRITNFDASDSQTTLTNNSQPSLALHTSSVSFTTPAIASLTHSRASSGPTLVSDNFSFPSACIS